MMLLQLSAAHGPAECQLAVVKALARLAREAEQAGLTSTLLEEEPGDEPGTLKSALLGLEGVGAVALAQRWLGTVQWRCPSPYRPRHARKNWFIGVAACAAPTQTLESEIRFEACKAGGPGGQHVNKTESAIRATHVASGISVRVQTERSQHANKRLAVALIAHKLAEVQQAQHAAQRAERRQLHFEVERGNPARVFKGMKFEAA
ncbi:peptide chain release factor [Andreprevotia lacus DSM 23236]|jgi:peptide chain release factor|uniref:Peptide chain release factor n=1 Tax=Andreprevotia lacus DSM 23236 TaxID=1121001 RepID=A0A1W1Y0H7_9NEIS|nr:peptide chain release factor H [Andreprevotia lacus]SMC29663.1 peptide chain release factor [Andreprevotia lacus DSM 23236]